MATMFHTGPMCDFILTSKVMEPTSKVTQGMPALQHMDLLLFGVLLVYYVLRHYYYIKMPFLYLQHRLLCGSKLCSLKSRFIIGACWEHTAPLLQILYGNMVCINLHLLMGIVCIVAKSCLPFFQGFMIV